MYGTDSFEREEYFGFASSSNTSQMCSSCLIFADNSLLYSACVHACIQTHEQKEKELELTTGL